MKAKYLERFEAKLIGLSMFFIFVTVFALNFSTMMPWGLELNQILFYAGLETLIITVVSGLSLAISLFLLQQHQQVTYMPIEKTTADRLNGKEDDKE